MSECRMIWRGDISRFLLDQTRHIDCEGGFRAGKTTAALWKVLTSCLDHPGIQWLICRYSDGDTQSKLKPAWREVCRAAGVVPTWDATEMSDHLPNGSKVYIFGIKAQDQISRYGKLRGIGAGGVAGIYCDQAEELPHDIFLEFMGRLSQPGHPHQLLLTPNPPDENHWLATEFPDGNTRPDRTYYAIPIYANAHNLSADLIKGLEQAYPPSHPKHRSAVLGQRGLNVIGKPVYGGDPERGEAAVFVRALHVRPLTVNPHLPVYMSVDFGKHHPAVVFCQITPWNQFLLLGGIMGQNLYLEDFAPLVARYRAAWFPDARETLACCDPAGSHNNSQGVRNNGIKVLQGHGIHPRYQDNSNAPDVRLAMVERLAAYMRKRTPQGEAFGVEADPQKWLLISEDTVKPWPFVADACEAGYVWDAHYVSVGSKQIRKPMKDGWYEHGMNCCEYLELNFGGAQPTMAQVEKQIARAQRQQVYDVDPMERQQALARRRGGLGRGGYR